ncbi:hypothetical protein [Asanoa iriomotensis]|uniref:hypothetical protein n=1 Tax=Asanoa iriomotensis TaxID=234613 RepID=UPI001940D52F|nr:hypothetical protein [Asanoa iriomotensis]
MKAQDWSALAAWVALAIGVGNLWFSVIRVLWKERRASPSAQLDLFNYQNRNGWHEEVRVVLTNYGPARMRHVEVELFDEDGRSLQTADSSVSALWPKMPVDVLHGGQSMYLTLNRSMATRAARTARIRWRDGRPREQTRTIGLSYNRLL